MKDFFNKHKKQLLATILILLIGFASFAIVKGSVNIAIICIAVMFFLSLFIDIFDKQ